jgi:hypothetical protein
MDPRLRGNDVNATEFSAFAENHEGELQTSPLYRIAAINTYISRNIYFSKRNHR